MDWGLTRTSMQKICKQQAAKDYREGRLRKREMEKSYIWTQKERDGEIIHLAHHQQITGKVTYKIPDREVFQPPNQPLK